MPPDPRAEAVAALVKAKHAVDVTFEAMVEGDDDAAYAALTAADNALSDAKAALKRPVRLWNEAAKDDWTEGELAEAFGK